MSALVEKTSNNLYKITFIYYFCATTVAITITGGMYLKKFYKWCIWGFFKMSRTYKVVTFLDQIIPSDPQYH